MKNTNQELHERFYAETNFEICENFKNWQVYALWLENISIAKLNQELILENQKLREAFYSAMDILEHGLVDKI